jgi:hypothetical protein
VLGKENCDCNIVAMYYLAKVDHVGSIPIGRSRHTHDDLKSTRVGVGQDKRRCSF